MACLKKRYYNQASLAPEPSFLTFDHLNDCPGVVHGIFSRQGGKSTGPCSGLNIGLSCGDNPDIVAENRSMMLAALGVDRAVFLNQVHGDDILVLKRGMDTRDLIWDRSEKKTRQPAQADAAVTDIPELGLVIQTADCQAVVLYDPVRRVVANIHSGWRGSLANVIGKCVGAMVNEFQCRPEHILSGISPSLGPCCAEFINYRTEIPEPFWGYRTDKKNHFDFWDISRVQLVEMGVKPINIAAMGVCTKCHSDRFFSYRAQPRTGRFGTVVGLEKGE